MKTTFERIVVGALLLTELGGFASIFAVTQVIA